MPAFTDNTNNFLPSKSFYRNPQICNILFILLLLHTFASYYRKILPFVPDTVGLLHLTNFIKCKFARIVLSLFLLTASRFPPTPKVAGMSLPSPTSLAIQILSLSSVLCDTVHYYGPCQPLVPIKELGCFIPSSYHLFI